MAQEKYLIPVDKADAYRYACNVVCVGETVIMPECSDVLQNRIRKAGYKVVTSDMSHFIAGGGAMHCLTNNITQERVVGGNCRHYGFEDRRPATLSVPALG